MKQFNGWHIAQDEDGSNYSATFGPDDFEIWWLSGRDRTDPICESDQIELLENCVYLAEAENREITQTSEELSAAIREWASDWNYTLSTKGTP